MFLIKLLPGIAFLFCQNVLAIDLLSNIVLTPSAMEYSGGRDTVGPGGVIGSTWNASSTVNVFSCGTFTPCNLSTMQPDDSVSLSGMTATVDGLSYTVFETGVPGIGYIIGLKDANATNFIPLTSGVVQTYPSDGTSGYAPNLGWTAKVTFVKTGYPLITGTYVIPEIKAAILTAYSGTENNIATLTINSTSISVKAKGCTVNTKSASVYLGVIDASSLASVGSTSEAGTFDVSITCDAGVWVNAIMTDQTTPSNTSSVVTLTSDSTASGVGVQFYYEGYYTGAGPVLLGPDTSASGAVNQFPIFVSTDTTQTLQFQAKYIRTGDIIPGSANALASITFSYQ